MWALSTSGLRSRNHSFASRLVVWLRTLVGPRCASAWARLQCAALLSTSASERRSGKDTSQHRENVTRYVGGLAALVWQGRTINNRF
jgi:hypothetical protein